jgi:hypothetical protein
MSRRTPKPRSRGKAKGGAFERSVCKALSLWLSDGKAEDLFWRSAMSGGRATVGKQRGKDLRRQCGDVSAVSAEGCRLTDQYFIECKHYKNLDIVPFMLGRRTGKLAEFWRKARAEAKKHDRKPMLIAKQNLYPTLVLVPVNDLSCPAVATVHDRKCDILIFDDMLKWKEQFLHD